MIIGIIQFPLPIIGNGEADIPKQLFIFNTTFDISLLGILWTFLLFVQDKISENSNLVCELEDSDTIKIREEVCS